MMFNTTMPFDMYPYNVTPVTYYPTHKSSKAHSDLSSNTSDEKDRRRKRSDASKDGDKESTSNMHMVRKV